MDCYDQAMRLHAEEFPVLPGGTSADTAMRQSIQDRTLLASGRQCPAKLICLIFRMYSSFRSPLVSMPVARSQMPTIMPAGKRHLHPSPLVKQLWHVMQGYRNYRIRN